MGIGMLKERPRTKMRWGTWAGQELLSSGCLGLGWGPILAGGLGPLGPIWLHEIL